MRIGFALVSLAALFLSQPAAAQGNVAQGAAETVQVVQSRQANASLMKQYTWNERLDFQVNGAVKDIRIDLVSFGPDGKLQRTVLNDEHSPLPGGFFRRRIAERKMKDLEKYMEGLRSLLHQYTLPTPGAVMNFMDAATTTPAPNGQLTMSGQGVVQPGDSLTVWVDAASKKTRKFAVTTTFQGNAVNLTATFATLPSGLNYLAYGEVTVPAKGYDLLVQNFDFNRN
jgi:hypothetical protein